MRPSLVESLACPACRTPLTLRARERVGDEIVSGELACGACARDYPIVNSIPRFVPADNYAGNFGFQWNRFSRTQLDSNSGLPITEERFRASTGWDFGEMRGKRVLDVGCGSGRFAEIALRTGAHVTAIDYSNAVDAARANLREYEHLELLQASVYELPFRRESFDFVYCLGVLQHTPNPQAAFEALPAQVKPGGRLAVDIYPYMLRNVLWSKYWLRPFTKRIAPGVLMARLERVLPALLVASRAVSSIPLVGQKLKYLLPVANYSGVYPLSETQLREWALLDTFDMLSPQHDHPQTARTLERWLSEARLAEIEVFRHGHLIGRGRKQG